MMQIQEATIISGDVSSVERGHGGMCLVWSPGAESALRISSHALRALLTMLGDRPFSLYTHFPAKPLSDMCDEFIANPERGRQWAEGLPSIPRLDYVALAGRLKSIADAATATEGARYPDNERIVRFE